MEMNVAIEKSLQKVLLEGIPYPAMLITRDRIILDANTLGLGAGAVVGGRCWETFGQGASIPERTKEIISSGGEPPAGTHCVFCRANESLDKQENANVDVEAGGIIWDTHWDPVSDNVYLHYAIDVTSSRKGDIIGSDGVSITEQYLKELESSRKLLAKSQEIGGTGSWIQNLNDHSLVWSDETYRIFGFELWENISYDKFMEMVHQDDRKLIEEQTLFALKNGEGYKIEYQIINKNLGERIVREVAEIAFDENGDVIEIIGIIRDITEQKKAEEMIKKSEGQFQDLFDTMREGFALCEIICDKKGIPIDYRFLKINNAFETQSGIDAKSSIGRTITEIYPDIELAWIERYGKVAITQEPIDFEDYNHNTKKYYNARAFSPEKGKFAMIFKDITERKLAEDTLKESEERLRKAITVAPLPIMIHADDGEVLQISDVWTELTGYTLEDIPTTPAWFEKAYREKNTEIEVYVRKLFDEIFELGKLRKEGEWEVYKKNGSKLIWDFFSAPLDVLPDGRRTMLTMATDSTERKKAEEVHEELAKDLADKNVDLQQLLYVASHDLRSPLVNVQGFSKELFHTCERLVYLLESLDLPTETLEELESIIKDEIPESIKYITSSTSKMGSLLDGLLELSRIEKSEHDFSSLDMNKLVGGIVSSFEYMVKEESIEIDYDTLPECIGNESQISRVFSNLLDNAIKYSDSNRPLKVKISSEVKNGFSVYCVADNGIGIKKESQMKIFELFHRLVHNTELPGEGLGLTTTKKIVERHRGEIKVKSTLGKGSSFYVTLPSKQCDLSN